MFKCEQCGIFTQPREKENKIVINKREKTYTNGDTLSKGWEIEEEISVCTMCNEKIKNTNSNNSNVTSEVNQDKFGTNMEINI